MFKPVNRLEKLMQAAAGDPKKARDFYRELVDSELYILTPDAAVAPGEDPLGVELLVRTEHFGGRLQRRSEGAAASRAGGEQHACVATQAFDLARAPLGAHVEVAARRRCPHRSRYRRAVATVADQQRALGGAIVGQGARARRLRD